MKKAILEDETRFATFVEAALAFLRNIEDYSTSSMNVAHYCEEASRFWNELARFRRFFKSTDQYISSIPSTLFAGMFQKVPAMRNDIEIVAGTEMRCFAGVAEDNTPIFKNQDVALGVQKPSGGRDKTVYLPLLFWECKESYIDSTMMNSPKFIGLMSRALFSGARGAVIAPSVTGAKASFFSPIHNLCNAFERNDGDRVFIQEILLEIYESAVEHVMNLVASDIANWRFPDYETFLEAEVELMTIRYPAVQQRLATKWTAA